jgi:hypothetical protein
MNNKRKTKDPGFDVTDQLFTNEGILVKRLKNL